MDFIVIDTVTLAGERIAAFQSREGYLDWIRTSNLVTWIQSRKAKYTKRLAFFFFFMTGRCTKESIDRCNHKYRFIIRLTKILFPLLIPFPANSHGCLRLLPSRCGQWRNVGEGPGADGGCFKHECG